MSTRINDFYTGILKAAGLSVSDDGFVSMIFDDDEKDTRPFVVKGKQIVLPNNKHLSNVNKTDMMIFHPLSENIMRGESSVMEEFRAHLNKHLHFTLSMLTYNLVLIASSTAEHAKLSPDQSEFLSLLKNADEKTVEAYGKILKAMNFGQTQKVFVHLYLKKGAKFGTETFRRGAVVTFPLFNELMRDGESGKQNEIFGVKVRAKDKDVFINLMKYIFPDIDTTGSYNKGSNSDTAPFLLALLDSFKSIAGRINDQIDLFSNVLENPEKMMIDHSWVDTFNNIETLTKEIRLIPMQVGNEGTTAKTDQPEVQKTIPGSPLTVNPTVQQTPVVQQQVMQPSPLPAVLNTPYQMGTPQTMFGVPNSYQPPTIASTSKGLDFDSVLRSNPILGGGQIATNVPGAGFQNVGWNNQMPNNNFRPGMSNVNNNNTFSSFGNSAFSGMQQNNMQPNMNSGFNIGSKLY